MDEYTPVRLEFDSSPTCKLCGSKEITELLEGVKDPLGHVAESFSIYKCNSCQVAFTFPVIRNSDLGFLYAGQYFSAADELSWAERLYRNDQYRYDFKLFRSLVSRHSKILDYGCGNGSRVRYLWSKGYENVEGVDKYKQGGEVVDRRLIGCDPLHYYPQEKYDVVTVYHVFEHLPDIKSHISHIRKNLLLPDGLLVVQVPNFDCWQRRYGGSSWVVLDVPRHYWHFNQKSLTTLLLQQDFKIIKTVARNSIFHPTSILSTIFGYDIRTQWRNGNKSPLRLQVEFLFLHLLATPLVFLENICQNSSILNVVARNSATGFVGEEIKQ